MVLIHTFTPLILLLLSSLVFSPFVESRLTKAFETSSNSNDVDQGTNWAVLVAGSNGYDNYRHQADICHAYQILRRGGLKDENIIVFMYDDIAFNEENPRSGIIINNPQGGDVYAGVPKDYTGQDLTSSNLKAAILGDTTSISGGSGKVVNSGPNDRIFIYYADHGATGLLAMPNDDDLYADEFINTLQSKHESGSYKSMVIYVEACEAGSVFEGLLPEEWNIFVTTASNPYESSYAAYCPGSDPPPPSEYDTCLGDLYSVSWMEDSDANNPNSETLEQQYFVVKTRTAQGQPGSHVMEYGNENLSNDLLSLYIGTSTNDNGNGESIPLSTVDQYDANLIYFKEKVRRAPEGSSKRVQAQKELDEVLSHRKHVDSTIQAIGEALFGASKSYEVLKKVRSKGQPIVDDWNCFKTLANTYKTYCGPLSTYGKKHMRAFANMCNAGVQNDQMVQAASQVCGPKN